MGLGTRAKEARKCDDDLFLESGLLVQTNLVMEDDHSRACPRWAIFVAILAGLDQTLGNKDLMSEYRPDNWRYSLIG